MLRRKVKLLSYLMILLLLITGCAPLDVQDQPGDNNRPRNLALKSSIPWPSTPDTIDDTFRDSLLDFSWNLFQNTVEKKGNVLISPASVYLALGMTYNGAGGETRQGMAEALSATAMTPEEFNKACRDYINILRTTGKETELSIANSIWYRAGFPIANVFLQTNADYFDSAAQSLDFNQPSAVQTINGWVDQSTKGTIDKIVEEITPETMMYLINAVYFKSDWKVPFEGAMTRKREFHTPGGKVTADFMNQMSRMEYFEKDGTKGVVLPYVDGRFQFFAILPEETIEIRSFIDAMDGAGIYGILTSIRTETVQLSLPKFETRYGENLNDALTRLGMGLAFDSAQADFFPMLETDQQDTANRLFISKIVHKTYCRVDELGTEASAVTSVTVDTAGFFEPQHQLVFDRPFVYGIADVVTGAPLFLGKMENPTQ